MTEVTRILSQIESGDPSAADKLLPPVYEELRKLAAARLAHEAIGGRPEWHFHFVRKDLRQLENSGVRAP